MLHNINNLTVNNLFKFNGKPCGTVYDFLGNVVEKKFTSFCVLGDSYSTFVGHTDPVTNNQYYPTTDESTEGYGKGIDVLSVSETWWKLFEAEYGATLLQNNSFSGSPVCYDGYGTGVSDAVEKSFVTRSNNLKDADLILVFGATNDSWINVTIGDYVYSGWTNDQLTKFRPALACMLNNIKTQHPNSQIVFMVNTDLRTTINESIDTICAHYDVPVLKLANISKASGHPDKAGMIAIKNQLIDFIKTLI